jgi:riboflavin kinase/FMN adenylyltransferase
MRIIRGRLEHIPPMDGPKITLGTFDGVHLGHRTVLTRLRTWARRTGSEPVVITFDRRPAETVGNAPPEHITSLKHRLLLIEHLGIAVAVVLEFDRDLATCEAEDFVRILVSRLRPTGIMLGHDTRFGRGGRGDINLMKTLGRLHGFEVREAPAVTLGGRPISSTRVRDAIKRGDLDLARKLLGRPYSTLGTVVAGTGRGRMLGYATANLDLHNEVRLPEGVYATKTGFDGRWRCSVTNIGRPPGLDGGRHPTFLSNEVVVETHILDFSGDLYGRDLEVRFLARLRPERRFTRPESLRSAIAEDIRAARAFHAADTDRTRPIV